MFWIEGVTQRVTDQIPGQHKQDNRHSWNNDSIPEFQRIILSFFPGHRAGAAANVVPFYPLGAPNQQMVAEDLQQAQSLLHDAVARDDKALILYGAQFLHSVAEAAGNEKLSDLALRLGKSTRQGRPLAAQAANLQSYLSRQIEDRQKPVQ